LSACSASDQCDAATDNTFRQSALFVQLLLICGTHLNQTV